MKEVLIITNKFPYGKDETFLETELSFLVKSNLKVTIFSQNTDVTKRNIPDQTKHKSGTSPRTNFWNLFRFGSILLSECIKVRANLFKTKVFWSTYRESIRILIDLQRIVKENGITKELIVYSYWHDNSTLAAILLKRKYPNLKVVTRVHGGDLYSERSKANYLPFRQYVFKKIDRVFCISKHGKLYLDLKYPLLNETFKCSYLGTKSEVPFIATIPQENRIVSCSHINPVKRLDRLINSLAESDFHCHWDHYGYGFDYNEKPIFDLLSAKLPTSHVSFTFHGQLANDRVIERLSSGNYSCFINVSKSEGLPVSMMEAMSCGIPCVGTDVGGVSEIIENGVNGILLSSDPSNDEILNAIKFFLDKTELELQPYRKNAYSTWESKFNAVKNYTEFGEILKEL